MRQDIHVSLVLSSLESVVGRKNLRIVKEAILVPVLIGRLALYFSLVLLFSCLRM